MKPGRNDPCPCGSGLKYKKCCGATQEGQAPAAGAADRASVRPGSNIPRMVSASASLRKVGGEPRPCGDCSACCDGWLKTHVLGHDISLGHPCPFSDGHHCTIHERRPHDPCRVFFCGWAEGDSELPDWMQPNKSGVIVLTGRSQWQGRPVDVLVSAGRDPDTQILEWYQAYSIKNLRPFMYQREGLWYGFGPPAFQQEVAAKAARGAALWI